jgi:hypothetical protein
MDVSGNIFVSDTTYCVIKNAEINNGHTAYESENDGDFIAPQII